MKLNRKREEEKKIDNLKDNALAIASVEQKSEGNVFIIIGERRTRNGAIKT